MNLQLIFVFTQPRPFAVVRAPVVNDSYAAKAVFRLRFLYNFPVAELGCAALPV